MNMKMHNLEFICQNFQIYGDFVNAEPCGSGHINDTYLATYNQAERKVRYIFRKINSSIFKNPEILLSNTSRVISHIHLKLKDLDVPNRARRVLTMIDSLDGKPFFRDREGNYWCSFLYLENTVARQYVETPDQAYQAAKAFGFFQKNIVDLNPDEFEPTIPDFHHIGKRIQALDDALQRDPLNRKKSAEAEVRFYQQHRHLSGQLNGLSGDVAIPVRLTHNDTKLNNVLLDRTTGEGLCVIDLDTVMPGTVLSDFGDMVRSFTSPAPEDEADLSKVCMRQDIFEALSRGYLSEVSEILIPAEINRLVYGARVMTFMQGIRFLTDYLSGDVYYKTSRPSHNLERCRNQFRLFSCIEEQSEEMVKMIERINSHQGTKTQSF